MAIIQGGLLIEPQEKEIYVLRATAALGVANAILTATVQPSSGTTVVTTGINNPDVPRVVTVTGNQASCTGNLVVAGTDYNDATITDTLAISGVSTVVGTKAFKTITSITVPTRGAASDSVTVGTGAKLGLPMRLKHNTVFLAFLNGVKEGTLPTVAVDYTNVSGNTIQMNSALNGTEINVYFIAE